MTTREEITGTEFAVNGLAQYVPGVRGSALKFDGFSSCVEGWPHVPGDAGEEEEEDAEDGGRGMELPREITVEAWVALGAYPWNWAPILTIGKHGITGFHFDVDSRGRVGFHMSDTQCRSSRVSIIESNDARCVVNWRYLQMDVKFRK